MVAMNTCYSYCFVTNKLNYYCIVTSDHFGMVVVTGKVITAVTDEHVGIDWTDMYWKQSPLFPFVLSRNSAVQRSWLMNMAR
jgi:hypothetical protein